jgi:uncharacterized DUF497 family protein
MKSLKFNWDEGNIGHIAQHGISPEEAEQVVRNRPFDLETQIRNGEDRVSQLGATVDGRVLVVVTTSRRGRIRVVTAWPAKERLRQFYETQRRLRDA